MKTTKTYTYCEFCDTPIEFISPPSEEQYEDGMIKIGDMSTVLLPLNVVERNRKDGIADSHAADLQGVYCNYLCLTKKIKKILKLL